MTMKISCVTVNFILDRPENACHLLTLPLFCYENLIKLNVRLILWQSRRSVCLCVSHKRVCAKTVTAIPFINGLFKSSFYLVLGRVNLVNMGPP